MIIYDNICSIAFIDVYLFCSGCDMFLCCFAGLNFSNFDQCVFCPTCHSFEFFAITRKGLVFDLSVACFFAWTCTTVFIVLQCLTLICRLGWLVHQLFPLAGKMAGESSFHFLTTL